MAADTGEHIHILDEYFFCNIRSLICVCLSHGIKDLPLNYYFSLLFQKVHEKSHNSQFLGKEIVLLFPQPI